MRTGRTSPLLMHARDEQGQAVTCVVKAMPRLATPPLEYLFEWLGAALARALGISTPEPLAVTIPSDLGAAVAAEFQADVRASQGRRESLVAQGARMPGSMKHPCQAVIVRYAPDASSGELLNIGVVVLSPGHRFMASRFLDRWARVTQAFPEADRVHLRRVASAIERSCEQHYERDQLTLVAPASAIDAAFDAAVPLEDSGLVRSAPITGLTADPEQTLNELFERYVAVRDPIEQRVTHRARSVFAPSCWVSDSVGKKRLPLPTRRASK